MNFTPNKSSVAGSLVLGFLVALFNFSRLIYQGINPQPINYFNVALVWPIASAIIYSLWTLAHNNKNKRMLKAILGICIILVSFYISNKIKDEFPPIEYSSAGLRYRFNESGGTKLHYDEEGNVFLDTIGKSELHHYCSNKTDASMYNVQPYKIDDLFFNPGDSLMVYYRKETINPNNIDLATEIYVGIKPEKLEKLEEGSTKIAQIYYRDEPIEFHILTCVNETQMMKKGQNFTLVISPEFIRPSVFQSGYAILLSTVTITLLLGEFVRFLESYFLESKKEEQQKNRNDGHRFSL